MCTQSLCNISASEVRTCVDYNHCEIRALFILFHRLSRPYQRLLNADVFSDDHDSLMLLFRDELTSQFANLSLCKNDLLFDVSLDVLEHCPLDLIQVSRLQNQVLCALLHIFECVQDSDSHLLE